MSRGLKLVLVVLLQTVALVTMVGMKQYTLNTGTPILLETEPVDPRSLFSGDYVRLNYKISRLDVDKISKESREWKRHETIYVTLKPSLKYAEPVGVAREMRTPKSGEHDDHTAPIDAVASIAITASGMFGMNPTTRSPSRTPRSRSACATLDTSS